MRRFSIVPLFIIFSFISPAQAKSIPADSQISAATVFADRATLTRTAIVDVPAGAHEILFENLPVNLYPDSLRVEGKGSGSVILGALSHKRINQADLIVPRERAINDQIQALEDRRLLISAEIEALEQKKAFFINLMNEAGERSREEIADFNLKPEQWTQAANTVASGIEESQKNIVRQQLEVREIDDTLGKLRRDLSQLRTGRKQSYTVSLPVEAKTSGRLTLELSYQMPNATWRPVYDARLDTKTGELEIIQYGAVTQRTGEDWTGIDLTLSTARPQRGASLPPISPMWVHLKASRTAKESDFFRRSVQEENAPRVVEALRESSSALPMPEAEQARTLPLQIAKQVHANIDTGGFTAEYSIPGPSDVLADGTESKLLIGPFETDSSMQVHVKPQLSQEAFLVARAALKGEAPILPGTVSLFRDDAYIGQSSLPLLRTGKEYDIYFGIDDQVEVKHNILEDKSGDSGLLGRDNVKEQRTVTTINNLRQKPVTLIVAQSVPVSKNKDIDIEMNKEYTTPGYDKDIENKKGVLQWSQNLGAQSKTDIKLGWKVTWPRDEDIIGLP